MNDTLRNAFDNIYDARVPIVWTAVSWLSSSLGFWFSELIERNNQFSSWCFKGRPSMFWMTGFFNPQGFLTAMLQEVTQKNAGWTLDRVSLHNDVTKYSTEECKTAPAVKFKIILEFRKKLNFSAISVWRFRLRAFPGWCWLES